MPRSIRYSALGAFFAFVAYLLLVPAPWTQQGIATAAITGFNIVGLLSLFVIFWRLEGATNAQFGRTVRENIGIVIPAMIISLIFTSFSLIKTLFP